MDSEEFLNETVLENSDTDDDQNSIESMEIKKRPKVVNSNESLYSTDITKNRQIPRLQTTSLVNPAMPHTSRNPPETASSSNYNTFNYESEFRVVKKRYLAARLDFQNKEGIMIKVRNKLIELHGKIRQGSDKDFPIDDDILEIVKFLDKKEESTGSVSSLKSVQLEMKKLSEYLDREIKECHRKLRGSSHSKWTTDSKVLTTKLNAIEAFSKEKLKTVLAHLEKMESSEGDRPIKKKSKVAKEVTIGKATQTCDEAYKNSLETQKEDKKQISRLTKRVQQLGEREKSAKDEVSYLEKQLEEGLRREDELRSELAESNANIALRESNLKKVIQASSNSKTLQGENERLKTELSNAKLLLEDYDKFKNELADAKLTIAKLEDTLEHERRNLEEHCEIQADDSVVSELEKKIKDLEIEKSYADQRLKWFSKLQQDLEAKEQNLLRQNNLQLVRQELFGMLQQRNKQLLQGDKLTNIALTQLYCKTKRELDEIKSSKKP